MANCLVTVSGTTGSVVVNYIDATAVPRTLTSGPGTFLIADTGTEYTWSNISGDAAVSSGCITFAEIENNCYILSWEILAPSGTSDMLFDSIVIGSDTYNIDDIDYPFTSLKSLGDAVNTLDISAVKAVGYKMVRSASKAEFFLILKVQGEDIPFFKIKNAGDTHHIYLKGVVTVDCLPSGYTEITTCEVIPL